ncbi:MAG: ABC transporter permease [Candidatus Saccharimonadales bacterium]
MRFLLIDHIRNAKQSLRATRMRTILTILGISIGIASMTLILSLSDGITKVVTNQVDALGGNVAVVRPGTPNKDVSDLTNPSPYQGFATSTITERDVQDMSELPHVAAASPIMIINGTVKADKTAPTNTPIIASNPQLISIANISMRDGQFIDSVTNRDTAVIGNQLSIDLFGTDNSIGRSFTIRDQTFTVIGILKRANDPINFNNIDFDHAAIISLESGKSLNRGTAQIQQINIRAKTVGDLPAALHEINQSLAKNHAGQNDYTILSGKEIAEPTSQLFFMISSVTTAIASISLVVGGIGIMNIMLVNVAERTREIGLRKAVGASNSNIIGQFMIEALIMSLLGGVIGYIFGYILAFVISSSLLTFDPAFTWQIAAIALGISVIIGGIFGLYPAIRAARKDPIESLRQYH